MAAEAGVGVGVRVAGTAGGDGSPRDAEAAASRPERRLARMIPASRRAPVPLTLHFAAAIFHRTSLVRPSRFAAGTAGGPGGRAAIESWEWRAGEAARSLGPLPSGTLPTCGASLRVSIR